MRARRDLNLGSFYTILKFMFLHQNAEVDVGVDVTTPKRRSWCEGWGIYILTVSESTDSSSHGSESRHLTELCGWAW